MFPKHKSTIKKSCSLSKHRTHIQFNFLYLIFFVDTHDELSIVGIDEIEFISCELADSTCHESFRRV